MKSTISSALMALTLASTVKAHAYVTNWVIDGETLNGYNPTWDDPANVPTGTRPTDNANTEAADINGPEIACGGASAGSGLLTYPINAGSSVTALWTTLDVSHKGPVTQYMAACPASGCDGVDAISLDWFKISEEVYEGGAWGTEKIINNGEYTFKIPSNLKSGDYLVRHDALALQNLGDPQFYPYCFQARLESSGTVVPAETVKFPDVYQQTDSNYATYNIYEQEPSAFVNPGPKVYSGASTDTVDEEVVVGGEDEETTSTGGVIVEDQRTASSGTISSSISSSSSSSVGTVTASDVVSIQTEVPATETGDVAATTSSSDWVDATETGEVAATETEEVAATGTGDVAATSSSSEWVDAPQETTRGYGRGGRKHGCTDDHQAQQTDAANYAGRRNGKRRL